MSDSGSPCSATSTATSRRSRLPCVDIAEHRARPAVRSPATWCSTARGRPRRCARLMRAGRGGRARRRGQHRHRGRRRRLRGGVPVAGRGARRPSSRPPSGRATSSPTTSWTGCAACPPSGACGSDDDARAAAATPRRAARPPGLPADLDPSTTVERVTRTRRAGASAAATPTSRTSASWAASSSSTPAPAATPSTASPAAGWALLTLRRRRSRRRSCSGRPTTRRRVAEEVSARGLPGDVYRAATDPHREVRPMSTTRWTRDAWSSPAWAPSRRWQRRADASGGASWRASRVSATIASFDPARVHQQDRRRGARLRPVARARSQGDPAQRPLRPSSRSWPRARRWTRRACRSASRASWPSETGIIIGSGLGGTGTLIEQIGSSHARARPRQPVLHPHGHRQHGRRPGGHQLRRAWAPTSRP